MPDGTLVTLMNKNRPVGTLYMDTSSDKVLEVGEVLDDQFLPVLLQGNYKLPAVTRWIKSRGIPEDRIGLGDVRKAFKIPKPHNRFSLSDQYWLQYTEKETWAKGNFFTNEYNGAFGRTFFSPWSVKDEDLSPDTPDLTTGGVLKKRWIYNKKSGKSSLCKMGDRLAKQDAIAEILSSMMLDKFPFIEHVQYAPAIDGLKICTLAENFIDENTEYVPASQVYYKEAREPDISEYDHLLGMIAKYASTLADTESWLDKLLFSGYVTLNEDLNLSNFGFVRSAETGEFLRFAPVFDCGCTFFSESGKAESKIFSEERINDAAYRIVKQYPSYMEKVDCTDMVEFIDIYPLLSAEEKTELKNRIQDIFTSLNPKLRR